MLFILFFVLVPRARIYIIKDSRARHSFVPISTRSYKKQCFLTRPNALNNVKLCKIVKYQAQIGMLLNYIY